MAPCVLSVFLSQFWQNFEKQIMQNMLRIIESTDSEEMHIIIIVIKNKTMQPFERVLGNMRCKENSKQTPIQPSKTVDIQQ